MKRIHTIFFCILFYSMVNPAFAGENVSVSVNGGTLYGTLETPAGDTPCPSAVIVSGSGPTDRDGNNPLMGGKNNCCATNMHLADAVSWGSFRSDLLYRMDVLCIRIPPLRERPEDIPPLYTRYCIDD